MHQRKQQYVHNDHEGLGQRCCNEIVDYNKPYREEKYRYHCHVRAQSGTHQLMMDMVLVGHEWRTVVSEATQRNTRDVKQRNNQCADSHQANIMHDRIPHRVTLPEVQKQKAEGEAQGKTACIAHEGLVLLAKDVIVEETAHYPQQNDGEHRPEILPRDNEQVGNAYQRDDAES